MDILVTRRLTLRPPLEVDAESITSALQNPNVARMLSSLPHPYTMKNAYDWIAQQQARPDEPCFAIYRQKFLGVVSVSRKEDDVPDLGYWLDEHAWGEGYISEAARAVVSHAFRKHGFDMIRSGAFEDNPASLKVLDKLGFEASGEVETCLNPVRQCEIACTRVTLTRERFESLFGSLESERAA